MGVHLCLDLFQQRFQVNGRFAGGFQHGHDRAQLLALADQLHLVLRLLVIATHGIGDFGQIAGARRRHDHGLASGGLALHSWQLARRQIQPLIAQQRDHALIQRGHAVVVEAGSDGAVDRHLLRRLAKGFMVALHLLAHVAQRVLGALAVELVDRHRVGEIQHVDLFQLRRGAEFRSHHIHRAIHQRHDGGVALTDAGGFDDQQVEAGQLAGGQNVAERLRHLAAGGPRRQRTHVQVRAGDGVHADAVAQQRAAGLAPRGVDGDDRDF